MATKPIRGGLVGAVALLAVALALAACGGSSSKSTTTAAALGASHAANTGSPPPEWAANADAWPAHNYDLSNTRATTRSPINAQNVSQLEVKWRLPLKGTSLFGDFATTPIVLNGIVYMQDLNSNVYAVDRSTGKVKWEHKFNQVSQGPNGLAYGYRHLYGVTFTSAFALDPATGKQVWSRKLTRNTHEAIDIAPQLYDNTVLVSTIPNEAKVGEGDGILWALDAATGKPKWSFNTVKGGAKLYGNPKLNGGGGVWYPPAVDKQGRVFATIANPTPIIGPKSFPNASSRPGRNLYTNSLVALDGATGKLLWFRQTIPHDVRDYDFEDSPIVTAIPIGGVRTEVVLAAGKAGWVYAYRASDGKQLWKLSVGKHQNDTGPLPRKPVTIFPGLFGGVETPMALADNRLFVPWDDLASHIGATGFGGNPAAFGFNSGRGGLTAVDAATGKVLWQRKLPSLADGAATVANDVVFTSTFAGTIYALDTKTGKTLWTAQAPAGINSFPAIDGDTLIVGAATTGFLKNPEFQVIAYSLNAAGAAKTQTIPKTQTATSSNGSGMPGNAAPSTKGTTIQVKGGEFFFRLSAKSAAKPGRVTFVFKNIGHVLHDFRIDGKQTPLTQPGKTAKLVVTFKKKGKFAYLCTVPGHAAAGMKGTFIVR